MSSDCELAEAREAADAAEHVLIAARAELAAKRREERRALHDESICRAADRAAYYAYRKLVDGFDYSTPEGVRDEMRRELAYPNEPMDAAIAMAFLLGRVGDPDRIGPLAQVIADIGELVTQAMRVTDEAREQAKAAAGRVSVAGQVFAGATRKLKAIERNAARRRDDVCGGAKQ